MDLSSRRGGVSTAGPSEQEGPFPWSDELLERAADCLVAGRPHDGRSLALLATQQRPGSVAAWTTLSWAELELGNAQRALDAAERALQIDPLDAAAWHDVAQAHALVGSWEQSLAYENRSLTIDPGAAVAWAGRGTALLNLERFPEAVACFDRTLALDPACRPALANRPMAAAQADPGRRQLLLIALGVASRLADGRAAGKVLRPGELETGVLPYFRRDPAYDADLVRGFDAVAAAALPDRVTPVMRHLCDVTLVLARDLGDPELVEQCRQRLAASVAALGSG